MGTRRGHLTGSSSPASAVSGPQSTAVSARRTRLTATLCVVFFTALNLAAAFVLWDSTGLKLRMKPASRGVLSEGASPTELGMLLQRFLPKKLNTSRSQSLTSALTSTYRLVHQQPLHVGDTAHFVIQAKDSGGGDQSSGGDFWFAVLTSADGDFPTAGGRTAGSVVDHRNGSYSVFFYAGWSGTARVHVTLAAPSSATKWLREKYWPAEKRVFWRATFVGKAAPGRAKSPADSTLCYLAKNATSPGDCVADHNANATGLTAFYCGKPKEPLTCDDIRWFVLDNKATGRVAAKIIGNSSKLFLGANFMRRLVRGPKSIQIASSPNRTESRPPVCKPDSRHLVNDGFWLDQTWHHLQCRVRRWDEPEAVRACLRHRRVRFVADSTVRSWYGEIVRKLGFPPADPGGQLRKDNYYEGLDLNMSYRFHPRVITKARVTQAMTPYEVDVLDAASAVDCGRYVFVFTHWAHFAQWTPGSYVERALLLRDAVLRFREQCPDAPVVVVKGAHPREHKSTSMRVVASDYTLWTLGLALRDIFRGTGVHFLDVWQMNLAYGPSHIHMPSAVISEEVNWFLTRVCGLKNSTA